MEIVSRKKTFDGVDIFLHADGAISDRAAYVRGGRLPAGDIWRAWEDVTLYTHAEIPELIRSVKAHAASWQRRPSKPTSRAAIDRNFRARRLATISEWREHLAVCRAHRCRQCS